MSEKIDKIQFNLAKNTLNALIEIFGIWVENRPFVMGSQTIADDHDWYEENIFNEGGLYKALGKDHARSVLNMWREFKEACHVIRKYKAFDITEV